MATTKNSNILSDYEALKILADFNAQKVGLPTQQPQPPAGLQWPSSPPLPPPPTWTIIDEDFINLMPKEPLPKLVHHGALAPGPFRDVVMALPLAKNQVWLCGGAVRRYIEGGWSQMSGDWDLFLSKSLDETSIRLEMHRRGGVERKDSRKGTIEWDLPTPAGIVHVQAITFKRFNSGSDVLNAFDFTINQGMVVKTSTGEPELVSFYDFEKDVADRILRPVRPRSLSSFIRRYTKFLQEGYYMPDKVLIEWVKRLKALPAGEAMADYFELPEDALL